MELIDKALIVGQANIEITNCRLAAQQGILTKFGKGKLEGLEGIVDFINTLEVKEIDLEKETPNKELADEIDALSKRYPEISFAKLSRIAVRIARWQKEQDEPTASDRGMADEIIVHLKRIEEDYRLSLTKEIQWLRNITKI